MSEVGVVEVRVAAAAGHEPIVIALFDYSALLDNDDPVSGTHGFSLIEDNPTTGTILAAANDGRPQAGSAMK